MSSNWGLFWQAICDLHRTLLCPARVVGAWILNLNGLPRGAQPDRDKKLFALQVLNKQLDI